jgi:hypothetical protein
MALLEKGHVTFNFSILFKLINNLVEGPVLQNNYSHFKKDLFCSTLSEFENFLLCERILINVTTCQTNFKSFKRFGAFKGLVEQKKRCIQLVRV